MTPVFLLQGLSGSGGGGSLCLRILVDLDGVIGTHPGTDATGIALFGAHKDRKQIALR
jgi:hypothetical protein